MASAARLSTTMRAAGCGEVTSATWCVPDGTTSAAKRPLPTTKRLSSRTRRSDDTKRKRLMTNLREPSPAAHWRRASVRSEEHTSELQSRGHLVCRLLLEKK